MKRPVLVDTSALVSAFRKAELTHALCVRTLAAVPAPLVTTWPVLTETAYLLRRESGGTAKVAELVREGVLRIESLEPSFLDWYEAFAAKYDDREVDLADASLVHVAERLDADTVLTLDRRDFSVYRIDGTGAFHILPAPM